MTESVHPVLAAAATYRRQLLQREDAAVARLVTAYGTAYQRMGAQIQALQESLDGRPMPFARAVKQTQLLALRQQIETELGRFGVVADNELSQLSAQGIQLGLDHSTGLVVAHFVSPQARQAITASFTQLVPEQVETLLGFLAPDSPLRKGLTNRLGPYVADRMSNAMVDGMIRGFNPNKTAGIVRRELGVGLDSAINTVRTANLWAYREATRANYVANQRIVSGWTWYATLGSDRTCFPAGTLVTTRRGLVPIEQVVKGDLVLTHTGHYRRVTETMRRVHGGVLVEVIAGNRRIICTEEHPLLVQRQGQLNWVEARTLRLTDGVVCQVERCTNQADHAFGQVAIQPGVGDTNNGVASGLQPQCFAGIALADGFTVVPIRAINLEHGIHFGQEEVNRVSPSGEGMFLKIRNANGLNAQAGIAFGRSLSGKSPIAAERAEGLVVGGNCSELFSACGASLKNRRAAAFFGTIVPSCAGMDIEDFSASVTGGIDRLLAWFGCLGDNLFFACALPGAEAAVLPVGRDIERLTARLTSLSDLRLRLPLPAAMRMLALIQPIASGGAELAAAAFDLFRRDLKWFSALNALNVHDAIIPQNANHVQVYNLEVEDDHSYVAGGMVVHNCMSCIAKHGGKYPVDAALNDHHMGRCTQIPSLRMAEQLGITPPEIEPGEKWFNRQNEATQRQLMGPAMFDAWKANAIKFSDLSQTYDDPVYGTMTREASLKELLGDRAKKYYTTGGRAPQSTRSQSARPRTTREATDIEVPTLARGDTSGDLAIPRQPGVAFSGAVEALQRAGFTQAKIAKLFDIGPNANANVAINAIDDAIEIAGQWLDKKTGELIGECTRRLFPGEKKAYLDLLSFEPKYIGNGAGIKVARDWFDALSAAGYEKAELYAGLTIGRYAWAKEGAKYLDTEQAVRSTLLFREWTAERGIVLDEYPTFADVLDVATYRHPQGQTLTGKDIKNRDVPPDMVLPLGKAFMLDVSFNGHGGWNAVIDLTKRRE